MNSTILNVNAGAAFLSLNAMNADQSMDIGGQDSFGQVLGAVMGAENVPEVTQAADMPAENEAEELTGLAALANSLLDEDAVISADTFSSEGADAFIRTLDKFFADGEISPEGIKALWAEVPEDEKQAYADLISAMCRTSTETDVKVVRESEKDEDEKTLNEIIGEIVSEAQKLRKKQKCCGCCEIDVNDQVPMVVVPDDPVSEDVPDGIGQLAVDDGDVIHRVDDAGIILPVNDDASDIQIVDNGDNIPVVDNMSVVPVDDGTDDLPVVDNLDNIPIVDNTGSVQVEDNSDIIQARDDNDTIQVEDTERMLTVDDTDNAELEIFCNCLKKELCAEIEANTQKAESTAADTFASGRQAFMARVRDAFAENEDIPRINAVQTAAAEMADDGYDYAQPVEVSDTGELSARIAQQAILIEERRTNSSDVSMKLSPEGMGDIRIRIRKTDEGMSVFFAAQRSEAAAAIGDRAAALADALSARGIKLKEISVTQQITSERSNNNALDYMGSGQDHNAHAQDRNSQGRRFVFDDGVMTETAISEDAGNTSEIYYDREAKLWVSI